MNPNIEYRLVMGNVIWSVILIETIVGTVYFVGFDLYEPIGKKNDIDPNRKGIID